jgi:hypothetical protein
VVPGSVLTPQELCAQSATAWFCEMPDTNFLFPLMMAMQVRVMMFVVSVVDVVVLLLVLHSSELTILNNGLY